MSGCCFSLKNIGNIRKNAKSSTNLRQTARKEHDSEMTLS